MNLQWEEGFTISVDIDRNTAVIRANREGLLSLANHLALLFITSYCLQYKKLFTFLQIITNNSYNMMVRR